MNISNRHIDTLTINIDKSKNNQSYKSQYLNCAKYLSGICQSCSEISVDYDTQIANKQSILNLLLSPFMQVNTKIFPTCRSELAGFRYKAKMVVTGQVERVTLGILDSQQQGVDLTDCPLYPNSLLDIFPLLKQFIQRAGLTPYNVKTRRGELKYILVTQSFAHQTFMVRFVLASHKKVNALAKNIGWLQTQNSAITIISVNIQPVHQAILEGEEEVVFTDKTSLEDVFNNIPLHIQPQSFFQTHPRLASLLYQTAVDWVIDKPILKVWDLFCGVGGFGLHILSGLFPKNSKITLIGIEISAPAIASAKESAKKLGLAEKLHFQALDANHFVNNKQSKDIPDLLVVNPPRRGLTTKLARKLNQFRPQYILYSSCNAESLVSDLASLVNYQLDKVQLFDFFPHTKHYEVLVLLSLRN